MHFNNPKKHFLKTLQERTFVAKLYSTVNCVCMRVYLEWLLLLVIANASLLEDKCIHTAFKKKPAISCCYYFYHHYCGFYNHMCFSCLITKLKLSVRTL